MINVPIMTDVMKAVYIYIVNLSICCKLIKSICQSGMVMEKDKLTAQYVIGAMLPHLDI